MKEARASNKEKVRGILVGLFGWSLFSNLFFWISFFLGMKIAFIVPFDSPHFVPWGKYSAEVPHALYFDMDSAGIIFIWLITIIMLVILFARKSRWVGEGILIAVILSMVTSFFMTGGAIEYFQVGGDGKTFYILPTLLLPMPSGIVFLLT